VRKTIYAPFFWILIYSKVGIFQPTTDSPP